MRKVFLFTAAALMLCSVTVFSAAEAPVPAAENGIITAEEEEDGRIDFYILRKPQENPRMKEKRKITILWRTELARLQEKNHLPKYREKSKEFVQEKLLEKVPGEVLWPQVYEELMERDYTTIKDEIAAYRRKK